MKVKPFRNEPFTDFSKKSNIEKQKKAIALVRRQLGKTYEMIVGGKKLRSNGRIVSYNPSNKDEIIAKFYKGTKEIATRAVETAHKKFEDWKLTPAEKRAGYIFKASAIIKKRRFEINSWIILETGKNYLEADADTAEAIDFLEFYGREMLRYAAKQPLTPLKGEKNELVYLPLGVGVTVPPWNFPFALLVGMASAAIVAGNTVVLKPSSDSPMIGKIFCDIMKDAGLPDGVINFFPAQAEKLVTY